MYKLISAGFYRLCKSFCFKIYIECGFLYGLFNVLLRCLDVMRVRMYVPSGEHDLEIADPMLEMYENNLDSVLFDCAMTLLLFAAVFIAFFIGREHSDGTIRNKLIVGYDRGAVYLSNLIVCVTANIFCLFIGIGVTMALGIPLLGTSFTFTEIAVRIGYMIAADIAVTALMVFGAMLIKSKAAICATLLISVFACLIVSIAVSQSLAAPEYYNDYEVVMGENGEYSVEMNEGLVNPYYVTGVRRQIYEFLDEALPISQLYHMAASAETPEPATALTSDAVILIAISAAGILIFRKKNIK